MYGVDLRLDAALESQVVDVWEALDAAGVRSLATTSHRRHLPHLSLAVGPSLNELSSDAVAGLVPPASVTFSATATFGPEGGVVFLVVQPTAELLEFHAQVIARCGEVDALYRPGSWTPHVTIAYGLPEADLGRAVQAAVRLLPLSGSYAALDVVSARTGERHRLVTYGDARRPPR